MNTQIINEIRDAFKTKLAIEKLPNVIPVIEVNPKIVKDLQCLDGGQTTSGNSTITMPTDRDNRIYSIQYSFSKNAACDIATGLMGLYCTINGKIVYLIKVGVLTLTAERADYNITFPKGLKIDRNTNIVLSGSFTAGLLVRYAAVAFDTDEYSNA